MQADGKTERQTDRRTNMTKLIVSFLNFVKALKKCSLVTELSAGKTKISLPTTINIPAVLVNTLNTKTNINYI